MTSVITTLFSFPSSSLSFHPAPFVRQSLTMGYITYSHYIIQVGLYPEVLPKPSTPVITSTSHPIQLDL